MPFSLFWCSLSASLSSHYLIIPFIPNGVIIGQWNHLWQVNSPSQGPHTHIHTQFTHPGAVRSLINLNMYVFRLWEGTSSLWSTLYIEPELTVQCVSFCGAACSLSGVPICVRCRQRRQWADLSSVNTLTAVVAPSQGWGGETVWLQSCPLELNDDVSVGLEIMEKTFDRGRPVNMP